MKNNWLSRNSKFYPLLALVALSVMQFLYAHSCLQSYRDDAKQDYETLRERMREDNVPFNVKEHIIYVQNQATFNTSLLISSLSWMQIFVQFNILMVFYSFYLKNRSSGEDGQSKT